MFGAAWPRARAIAVLMAIVGACGPVDENQIEVQTRPCAIEGSSRAQGRAAGEIAPGTWPDRITKAGRIWDREANIRFRSRPALPVIADPSPPTAGGKLGDVEAGFLALEPQLAAEACLSAWEVYDPEALGVIVVHARAFTGAGLTMGVTAQVPLALRVKSASPLTGKRGDDLCGHPRSLTKEDVDATSWTVVVDEDLFGQGTYSGDPVVVLAHELGHVLMLGHGNGLDDNLDGLEPPNQGPRRFDSYCDPLATDGGGVPAEEAGTQAFVDCDTSSSLMRPTGSACQNLRPLQVEQARATAVMIPGSSVGGVFVELD